ncbi:MAG TPA: ADP-ribosylglycohydrolase family protein [Marmoricola sp.]|nr:ADP-ribosylglycohydrolase family protein [Marmoricola sp.]
MKLDPAQQDRACGAILGTAIGDALGAPYEFGFAHLGPDGPRMIGGGLGGFAPGEWTDDTTMAWAILEVAASRFEVHSEAALTRIAGNFRDWYDTNPPDIGNQTRRILGAAGPSPTGAAMTAQSSELHQQTGHTAGNGSLMRTAPVALTYLNDPDGLIEAARRVSTLTHFDPRAQEACVLWSLAIRHAILHGEFDLRGGLAHLEADAAAYWTERIDEAETGPPNRFRPNGWVVTALQAAWSAIVRTPMPSTGPECEHLAAALGTAIAIGDDTDTVAAIAGGLLGARYGASAFPAAWRRMVHGYPGLSGEQLVGLAHLAANGGSGPYGWPTTAHIDYSSYGSPRTLVQHPYDEGVWMADASVLDQPPEQVGAVVSLCLVGREQVPTDLEHVTFRLIDQPDEEVNPNLEFILADAARAIAALRAEGHQVVVHCVAAQSRTPTVAIAYALLMGADLDSATEQVCGALPQAHPNAGFRAALRSLADSGALKPNPEQEPA